jgi:photosystem II stability/assembly factor-like uncharacterized protein
MKRLAYLIISVFSILATTSPTTAQWKQIISPSIGYVFSYAKKDTHLFLGTASGIYVSANNGSTWNAASAGLPQSYPYVLSFVVSDSNIFAAVGNFSGGIFLSTNNGISWNSISVGKFTEQVNDLVSIDNNLVVGTSGGVFVSANQGSTWKKASNGLTYTYINTLAVSGQNIFAGTWGSSPLGGVFRSTDNGSNWTRTHTGITTTLIYEFAVSGANIFVGTYDGVFLSTDIGTTWIPANAGLTSPYVSALTTHDSMIFAGTNKSVFVSTNQGTTWIDIGTGLPRSENAIISLAAIDGYLYASTVDDGLWRIQLSQIVTSVYNPSSHLPISFKLNQNFPNPFNSTTTLTRSAHTYCGLW